MRKFARKQARQDSAYNSCQFAAPANVHHALASSSRPLDSSLRSFFEPQFGHDFSKVRVHSNLDAEQSARDVNAHAYTTGNDIVFAKDQYAPETSEGRQLIAHELSHVVQQSRHGTQPGHVLRKPAEPRYPSEGEQKEIEKLLKREYKQARVVTSATGTTTVTMGRMLKTDEIKQLAVSLEKPFVDALNLLDRNANRGETLSTTEAFDFVKKAREDILDKFGKYTKQTIPLTQDATLSDAARKAAGQVLVVLGDPDASKALAITILDTHCEECVSAFEGVDQSSKDAFTTFFLATVFPKHEAQLRRVAAKVVPGKHTDDSRITLRLKSDDFYKTAVHELVHQLAHPAFTAAFIDQRNIIEGFTDYFAHQIYGNEVDKGYKDVVAKIQSVREVLRGPFQFVNDESGEESLRQAYFMGKLELIGWVANNDKERKAVAAAHKEAGEPDNPGEWNAATAGQYEKKYRKEAFEYQAPSRNVLSVGLFLTKDSPNLIAVRYARVIARTELARGQLYLEGQAVTEPSKNPTLFGGTVGIGGEYQEPKFYAGGGVRFGRTDLPGTGTNRLDVTPFIGFGFRPWQIFRVGLEGYLAVPTDTDKNKVWAIGATVGVEL